MIKKLYLNVKKSPNLMGFAVFVSVVLTRDQVVDPPAGAPAEARGQRGHRIRLLPPPALEESGWGTQPAALHLGGQ